MYADCTWKQNLSGFRLVIGRWKSDRPSSSRSRTLYWQFQFFSLDETIANTYFLSCLVPFYMNCSGDLIHCLKISGNIKNNLRTIWGSNRKKLRTAQPQPKVTGSYKKSVYFLINRMLSRFSLNILVQGCILQLHYD